MRPTRFRAGAAQPLAAKGLHANDGAYHVAVDVDVADLRGGGQRLRAGVDAGLDAQGQAVAQGVDLRNDGFGRGEPRPVRSDTSKNQNAKQRLIL